jgi:transcriptional regulator
MYASRQFAASDDLVRELLTHHGAADGLAATILPFVYDLTIGEHSACWGTWPPASTTTGGTSLAERLAPSHER